MSMMIMVFALVLTGCGPTVTDVTGTVTFQAKPVVFGTVMLIDAGGVAKYGDIKPDGSFTILGVQPGPVKVAVSSPTPPGVTPPKAVVKSADALEGLDGRRPADTNINVDPIVAKGWFPLPELFNDPSSSNLTAEIVSGQALTLALK